ncbi:hypothetical protein RHMOL_Rhmol06G0191800 [Rhododendron molle]|uniref:Uncharacterized protein n=1 Tax=Rhododendron molle TaxID=49168 RepID=A0ACC0NFZ3_RHOML|nr:hypothetical protein RHMOL_Rhmol06G0191800 [Rhododendron molle]
MGSELKDSDEVSYEQGKSLLKTVESMLELHSSCQTLEMNEGNDKRRKSASLIAKGYNLKLKSSSEKAMVVKEKNAYICGNTNTTRYTGGAQLPNGESQCRSYGAFFEVLHHTKFPVPIAAAAVAAAASLFAQWL